MYALILTSVLAMTTAETLPQGTEYLKRPQSHIKVSTLPPAKIQKPAPPRQAQAKPQPQKPAPAKKTEPAKARVLQPQRRQPITTPARKSYPAIELYEVNLNETLHYRPFDDRGRPRKQSLAELTKFMRCHHTGKQHRVDPRLAEALYTVGRHFAGHRIEVFSGYRPKAYCSRAHSRHLTASAVDFRIPGVRNEQLIAWLRSTFHPSGVGYYPNGVHVHLDLDRDHDTYWIDAGDAPSPDEPADGSDAIGDILRHPSSTIVVGDDAAAAEATGDEPVEAAVPAPADSAASDEAAPASDEPPLSDPRFID